MWNRIDKVGRAGVSERESSIRARKFPGIFSKFYEPLEKIRARFPEKKFLPKKAHWCAKGAPKTKEHSAGNCLTLQSVSKRRQINLFDIFDAAQVGRQSKGSLATVEVGFVVISFSATRFGKSW